MELTKQYQKVVNNADVLACRKGGGSFQYQTSSQHSAVKESLYLFVDYIIYLLTLELNTYITKKIIEK